MEFSYAGPTWFQWNHASKYKTNVFEMILIMKISFLMAISLSKTMGRDKRLEYAASFELCYFLRLLYYAGTQYPIMGALR